MEELNQKVFIILHFTKAQMLSQKFSHFLLEEGRLILSVLGQKKGCWSSGNVMGSQLNCQMFKFTQNNLLQFIQNHNKSIKLFICKVQHTLALLIVCKNLLRHQKKQPSRIQNIYKMKHFAKKIKKLVFQASVRNWKLVMFGVSLINAFV